MDNKKLTKEDCIALLLKKQEQIGNERFVHRSDFSQSEVCAIKAFLGPWPRALETVGIKEPKTKTINNNKGEIE